jgi:hypothetical protein
MIMIHTALLLRTRAALLTAAFVFVGCFSTTDSTFALTVTATYGGEFDDGTTWAAVATWDELVMADNKVTISEMASFDVVTSIGPGLTTALYDISEAFAPDIDGFLFSGPTFDSPLLGPPGSGNFFEFYDRIADQVIQAYSTGHVGEFDIHSNDQRNSFGSVWSVSAVPEPSSVMLLALGAIGLVGSGGRRRRRR